MNYSQNINLSDPNDYTHIDKPIARNNNVNPVTWVNFIEFSSVDNFGYGNLSGSIGGTWLTVLDTINNLFKDLNDRLIIVENAINNIDPNPNPDPDQRTLTSIMWSSQTASSQKGAQISYPSIICVYNDGSTSSISATLPDVTISPIIINSSTAAGTYQLYATYQGKTTTNTLIYIIVEAQIVSIEWVYTSGSSQQGSPINWPQIRCIYDDRTTTTINATASGVSLSNNLTPSSPVDTYNITATYTINNRSFTTTNTLAYTITSIPPTTYNVTLTVNYGTITSGQAMQTVTSGGSALWTVTPNSGYKMPSSVSGATNATISDNTVTVSNVTSNQTIILTCERITYTVTYNANEGNSTPESQTVNAGSSVTLASAISRNEDANYTYTFAGWNTQSNGRGTNYAAGQQITLSSNLKLYAKWDAHQKQVTQYYFSVGTTAPTASNYTTANNATTTIPTTKEFTNNSGSKALVYVLAPSNKTVKATDLAITSIVSPLIEYTSITIPNHKVYVTDGKIANGGGIKITIS